MDDSPAGDDVARAAVTLPATPPEVWRLLVDRSSWWPELEFDARAGVPLRETWTEGGRTLEATGQVLAVDAPSHLSFEWTEPGWDDLLTVSVSVSPAPEGSTVTVTERGFRRLGRPDALRLEHEAGWGEHLARLRDACAETSPPGPDR